MPFGPMSPRHNARPTHAPFPKPLQSRACPLTARVRRHACGTSCCALPAFRRRFVASIFVFDYARGRREFRSVRLRLYRADASRLADALIVATTASGIAYVLWTASEALAVCVQRSGILECAAAGSTPSASSTTSSTATSRRRILHPGKIAPTSTGRAAAGTGDCIVRSSPGKQKHDRRRRDGAIPAALKQELATPGLCVRQRL